MSDPPAKLIPSKTSVARDEVLPYEVVNLTEQTISFGEPYRLEQCRERGWVEVRLNYGFRLPLYLLEPGGSRELKARIPADVVLGHYRLVKQVRTRLHVPPDETSRPAAVSFEFEVVEPAVEAAAAAARE